ncbi:hypothetical protein LTR78_004381 [Recurvomyces mirabilis]|uniref:Restriction of telomere capping protein 4 n=1 Tax=Recurvomyces mirabilis TaxID=574656 RepID=A0AAE0WPZ2_9PEZI|nr:hypothetical protein LTR78_004381 [Recurvomyces mirabilis]KAK5155953.1 hypothetical protein LTS14_005519 [Recurvomyces mirabilis]
MPTLRRSGVTKLLRTVNGKPHASDDDHEDTTDIAFQLPTPTSSNGTTDSGGSGKKLVDEGDIYADPLSSGDEKPAGFKLLSHIPVVAPVTAAKQFKQHLQLDGPSEEVVPTTFKHFKPKSPANSVGSKRSADDSDHAAGSDNDGFIFSSESSQAKKPRMKYTQNVHARPQSFRPTGYGAKAARQRSREEEQKKVFQVKQTKKQETEKAKAPAFKTMKLPDGMLAFSGKDGPTTFRQPRRRGDGVGDCEAEANGSDSDLSSLPGDEPAYTEQELAALGLPEVEPYERTMDCTLCEAGMPYSIREDFEDMFPQARAWTYKWQERFCSYHKRAEAQLEWNERGYPRIDWPGLPARLKQRKHTLRLKSIMSGELESAFKKSFEEKVKTGSKTLLQAATSTKEQMGTTAGYYGPRGETVMTDHIIATFGSDINDYAIKDKNVASAGVSGGVSGYVQNVLVPELTLSLISQDMSAKANRMQGTPLEVLTKSAKLGELLCPELDEGAQVVGDENDGDDDL